LTHGESIDQRKITVQSCVSIETRVNFRATGMWSV
jgi:hypothetical protein